MNYLRNITTSVLASTGVSFPFTIGDKIPGVSSSDSIWDIREGIKKDDQTPLTLFIFDSTLSPISHRERKNLFLLAKNALKKLRTIRHPNVLRYIDSLETDTHIYIATERVLPLSHVLREWDTGVYTNGVAPRGGKGKGKEEWLAWGVQSLSTGLAFLNSPPLSLHHAHLLPSSVFLTPALEFRLAGFDLLTTRGDEAGVLWSAVGGFGGQVGGDLALGDGRDRMGPEVRTGGWGVLRDADPTQSDTYPLALLLFSLYNPNLPLPPLSTAPLPSSTGALPRPLFPLYKRMLNPNTRTRLSTSSFIDEASRAGFWAGNALIELIEGLDGFELASDSEKLSLLRTIKESSSSLPSPLLTHLILPKLLHSLSLPTSPSSHILPLVLALGAAVPAAQYTKVVLEPVVRLWASPDRGTRMALLEGLAGEKGYEGRLEKGMVVDKIWPHLITGFADTVAVIREATVKAIPLLAPKLTDRILNNDLLRLLAKMQIDPEPSIRTNTCILLGRLAPLLGPNTKKKVLVPAFARSLKDSFVHARVAGLMAFMATVEYFDGEDLAGKVVPNMAFCLVDKEKLVREQAFKAMALFMAKIEACAAQMPDTILQDTQTNGTSSVGATTTTTMSSTPTGQSSIVNSAAGAAGALAGWAIASIGKQLPIGEVHSQMSAAATGSANPNASAFPSYSMPGSLSTSPNPGASPRASFQDTRPAVRAAAGPSRLGAGARAGGMQLGGGGVRAGAGGGLADVLAGEFEDEEGGNPWGQDDLIDVNADADDWSAFETAPTPLIVEPTPAPAKPMNGYRNGVSPARTASPAKPRPAPSRAPIPVESDGWDDDPTPAPPLPNLSTTRAKPAAAKSAPAPSRPAPVESDGWDTPIPESFTASAQEEKGSGGGVSLVGMSKEEKDVEMARRREERKARIAAMKEQKKAKA